MILNTFFPFFLFDRQEKERQINISVIADLHYYPPSFTNAASPDYQAYLAHDPKMLRESSAALDRALEIAATQHSDILLIPGDLTKDAELQGHTEVAQKLRDFFQKTGVRPFVIPGNHDVYNFTGSSSFESGPAVPVRTVTGADFRTIYEEFGYGGDAEFYCPPAGQYAGGLSYFCNLNHSFCLLALDTCRYSPDVNGLGRFQPVTGGAIFPDLLRWAVRKVSEATAAGKTVIGMAHHGVVPHFHEQEKMAKDFLIRDWKKSATALADAGLRYIFTGHMHANDISQFETPRGNLLHDFQTAALVSYGSFVREVQVRKEGNFFDTGVPSSETLYAFGTFLESVPMAEQVIPDYCAYTREKLYSQDVVLQMGWTRGVQPFLARLEKESLEQVCRSVRPDFVLADQVDGMLRRLCEKALWLSMGRLGRLRLQYQDGVLFIDPHGLVRVAGKQHIFLEQIVSRLEALTAQFVECYVKDPRFLHKQYHRMARAFFRMIVDGPVSSQQAESEADAVTPAQCAHTMYDFGMYIFLAFYYGVEQPAPWAARVLARMRSGELLAQWIDVLSPYVQETMQDFLCHLSVHLSSCFRGLMRVALRSRTRDGRLDKLLTLTKHDLEAWLDVAARRYLTPQFYATRGEEVYKMVATFVYDNSPDGTTAPYTYRYEPFYTSVPLQQEQQAPASPPM